MPHFAAISPRVVGSLDMISRRILLSRRGPDVPGRAQVIEEIIVTATKRETSLQDTPMSITALGEFELQRIGAEGILPAPTGLLGSDLVFHTYDDKDTEEIAVFDELTLRLSDSLRLTAGARWSETTIDFSANNVSGAIPPRVRDSFELLNFRIGAFQAGSWGRGPVYEKRDQRPCQPVR